MALSGFKNSAQHEELPEEVMSAEESDESIEAEEEVEESDGNDGWADSIAKVLGTTKPKTKKTLVLSRAKKPKLEKVKQKSAKEEFGFELAQSTVKEDSAEESNTIKQEEDEEETEDKPKKRKNVKLPLRIKPTWQEIERERALKKVATKGVVQLFNAVRVQQKELQEELDNAGPLDSRRDAVLNNIDKHKFLDVLMSGSRAKSENVYGKVKKEEEYSSSSEDEQDEEADGEDATSKKKKKWSVLDSDFLTSKKVKHWDEENDSEEADMASSAASDSDDE